MTADTPVSWTVRSWADLCRQVDETFDKERLQPKRVYEFSNGRTFDDKPNPYA